MTKNVDAPAKPRVKRKPRGIPQRAFTPGELSTCARAFTRKIRSALREMTEQHGIMTVCVTLHSASGLVIANLNLVERRAEPHCVRIPLEVAAAFMSEIAAERPTEPKAQA